MNERPAHLLGAIALSAAACVAPGAASASEQLFPMPANPAISAQDAKALTARVLEK